jgi:hypothetical protein
VMP